MNIQRLSKILLVSLLVAPLPIAAHVVEAGPSDSAQKDFQWYCESPDASPEQKKTVRAIYDRVPSIEAGTTCAQAMVILEAIHSLELEGKDLTDLSPLAGMKKIHSLHVDNNRLTSLDTLPGSPTLTKLYLTSNPLQEFPDLSRFPNLFLLFLAYSPIKNISNVEGIKNLGALLIFDLPLSDISFLSQLKELRYLVLGEFKKPELLETMPTMPDLIEFAAYDLGLDSFSFLDKVPNISFINIHGNNISDIQPLKKLPNLIGIDLTKNRFTTIPAGFFKEELENLKVGGNPIADFEFLRSVKKVSRELCLSESKFNDWGQIAHLVPLIEETLDLTDTEVSKVNEPTDGKQVWPNIQNLYLAGTEISSLSVFKKISFYRLYEFTGPDINNKTEENCPTSGVASPIAEFCKKAKRKNPKNSVVSKPSFSGLEFQSIGPWRSQNLSSGGGI